MRVSWRFLTSRRCSAFFSTPASITFKVFGWTGDVARDRIRLLKVKHAILGVVFLAGTAWQVAIAYF
jgi:hypothetical protein